MVRPHPTAGRAVSVIVPTQARRERAEPLKAALRSILEQEGVHAVPVVVVNGPDPDAALVDELGADPRLELLRTPQPSLAGALHLGVQAASTPWVSTLDDDDLLLPRSLAMRVERLEDDPNLDVVVGNGLRREHGVDVPHWTNVDAIRRDPLRAMYDKNWLLPGAWLARRERVDPAPIADAPYAAECTFIGLYLALHYKTHFLDEPVVIWRCDTPASMSKSREYVIQQGQAMTRILELDLPDDIRRAYKRRRTRAYHARSDLHRSEGDLAAAWYWHLRTLPEPGGWRHLLFGRRLLQSWFAGKRQ